MNSNDIKFAGDAAPGIGALLANKAKPGHKTLAL
jgi:hypothetical protein